MKEDVGGGGTDKPMMDIGGGRTTGDMDVAIAPNDQMEARPVLVSRNMTAVHRPDLRSIDEGKGLPQLWQFDFSEIVGRKIEALTDKETVSSAALAENLFCWGGTLEQHKIGGCVHKPGPPFVVENTILCNVGEHSLQRAFMRLAEDSWYQLYLALGVTVETSLGESWLAQRLDQSPGNPNNIEED